MNAVGTVGTVPADGAALADAARRVLEPGPFGYVAGGAGSGATVRANRAAFDRWRIVPRMLRAAHVRDLSTTVLGCAMPAPVALAPIGVQTIVHPEGELATARAAAALGLPFVLSTMASHTIEEVARVSAGPRWFQLYWPDDPDVCASLLRRAAAAGYSALVVTLDNWTFGWRTRDLDNGYRPSADGIGTANAFADPAFRAGLARPPEEDPPAAIRRWSAMFTGTDHVPAELEFLRANWAGPLLLKGVLHPDDAVLAAEAGADGVVVSNHGGRQIDGAVAALDALPSIAQAVGAEIPVLFDSGVRTGADVVKALCLGADAVLVGRPYVYGLALGGAEGARQVLANLLAEFDLTAGLSGARGVDDLTSAMVVPAGDGALTSFSRNARRIGRIMRVGPDIPYDRD